MGTRHGAAQPAAIGHVLADETEPHVAPDVDCSGVRAELEVLDRKNIDLIKDFDRVGSSDLAHPAMGVVERQDFPVHSGTSDLDGFQVSWMVQKRGRSTEANDNGLDPLVSKDRPRPASCQLLETRMLPLGIPIAGMDESDERVFCSGAGDSHADVLAIAGAISIHLMQDFWQVAAVVGFFRGGLDGDEAFVAIDEDDDILLSLALYFDRVET